MCVVNNLLASFDMLQYSHSPLQQYARSCADISQPCTRQRQCRSVQCAMRSRQVHCDCRWLLTWMNADQPFATYDTVLRDIAERCAPSCSVRCRTRRPTPWIDTECRAVRHDCHRLECLHRHSGSPDVPATWRHFRLYREKEQALRTRCFKQCGRSPPFLWHSLSSRLQRKRNVSASTNHTADGCAAYFSKKIDDIWCFTANLSPPEVLPRTQSIRPGHNVKKF